MRRRPSARLLVINAESKVLLFRFVFSEGPLTGQDYWATPGGAVDAGESFADAARRELFEETGLLVEEVGQAVADRECQLRLIDGECVIAEERYFVVRVIDATPTRENWTALEAQVIRQHRWWSIDEISAARQTIFPENLATILRGLSYDESPVR